MMFDTHLINVALASFGISAGAAILIAAAIIGIVAWHRHDRLSGSRRLTVVPAHAPAGQTAREREPQAA
jgi:hypothetical protein